MRPGGPNSLTSRAAALKTFTGKVSNGRTAAFWQSEYDRVVVRSESSLSVFTAVQDSDFGKLAKLLKKQLDIPDTKRVTLTFICEGDEYGLPGMRVTLQY